MPGMTTSPSASIVSLAPESRPMSVMTPSLMPTSATRFGSPEPSTTVPFLMIVSKLMPSTRCISVRCTRRARRARRPGAERARDAEPARAVARPDVAVEAVVAVVGERDRLRLVVERDRRDDRSEDLLARDRHVVPRVREERLLDVEALREIRRTLAAACQRRAFLDTRRDELLDAAALHRGHERPDDGPLLARIADLEPARDRDHLLRELVVDRALDEEPCARDADLARVERPHLRRALERGLARRVGEDDLRRLAAELEQRALEPLRRRLLDLEADAGTAGERDHVDVVRRDERLADL